MKLNLKNLTACMAISLGTICSVNAMNQNFNQEEQPDFNHIVMLCFENETAINIRDENDVREKLSLCALLALLDDGDAAIGEDDVENIATNVVDNAIKEYGINNLTPVAVMLNIDQILSDYRKNAIAQRIGFREALLPEIITGDFITVYNNRYGLNEPMSSSMRDIIDVYASVYATSVDEHDHLRKVPMAGLLGIKAEYVAISILEEVATYMFIAIANELNNGNNIAPLIHEFNEMLEELFRSDVLTYTYFFEYVREHLDQLRQNIRHQYGDLSVRSPYRNAVGRLANRYGGLQGAINAVNEACMKAKGNVPRG